VSAPPYRLTYAATVAELLHDMSHQAQYEAKLKKIRKALRLLSQVGPSHPGLKTHKMQVLSGPGGKPLWNCYVENNTPSAWRILWVYGDEDEIQVVSIGPHP
jgi:hypothetical protein